MRPARHNPMPYTIASGQRLACPSPAPCAPMQPPRAPHALVPPSTPHSRHCSLRTDRTPPQRSKPIFNQENCLLPRAKKPSSTQEHSPCNMQSPPRSNPRSRICPRLQPFAKLKQQRPSSGLAEMHRTAQRYLFLDMLKSSLSAPAKPPTLMDRSPHLCRPSSPFASPNGAKAGSDSTRNPTAPVKSPL
ncbi:hypothetical protein MA16_Dca028235 [Dendrobium catenatum]|uniref:Uncharacterized protein n=1 Tax=Dendrobium catenatum TaxID=906689 RepID=A0A2I0VH30_9ASPA|nr:hypothetical protein MA16_Dca028235 [Dendrobium catenatum]